VTAIALPTADLSERPPRVFSPKHAAVSLRADKVTSGDGVTVTDDDSELVREILPFGLKVYESLLVVLAVTDLPWRILGL
jgi:hypothetical protein